ncbi:MAG: hypothetical protein K2K70_04245 [Lachnospiraceae bacterium]|nr:hypothetical protein [Lachnospiraceae bacterium]
MPIFFICFIVFIIWLQVKTKQGDKVSTWDEAYWEKEYQSNFARKKDPDDLDYITVDMDRIPMEDDCSEEERDLYTELEKILSQPIINLSNLSNADLKLTYGIANFEKMSAYDQNYTRLIRTLNRLGNYCFENGNSHRAKQILEYAIELDSDISSTYTTLASIYLQEDAIEKIQELIHKIEQTDSLMKETIKNKLLQMIQSY